MLETIGRALWMSLTMLWQIFWGVSFGFLMSAVIEVVVSKAEMSKLLPDASPRTLARASVLGAASSSCSYAAVAMARSIVRKGGDFTAAMAFQFAATNLVLELGILLWVLLGWQFAAFEFTGAPLMIALLALLFRRLFSDALRREATANAKRGIAGRMEGHAEMAMDEREGNWRERLTSKRGWIAISHGYAMNWLMLWRDIGAGLLVAGALAAWVPAGFWQRFFLVGHPDAATVWGALAGPLIALASFTCSVGNVPLAAVLWKGGISFGGIAAFIFGDLIILPILDIYRKYYGLKVAAFLAGTFYVSMVVAALVLDFAFRALHLVPAQRSAAIVQTTIRFNYTSVLDLVALALLLALGTVFVSTGGVAMLRAMRADDNRVGKRE